jgi:ABC-type polysaccharide/polyol phosphate transport system ATPase subunit
VVLEGVTKSFRIPKEHRTTMKENFVHLFRRVQYEPFEALSNINMTVEYGDFFGVIGLNGSGKSTLLKVIASIYDPDEGRCEVNGRVAPFLELGLGFNGELTGRENVFLNGIIMGLTRKEVRSVYDEIVDFSEIGRFMEMKVKNYSSGMLARLGFAVSIHVPAEIMLLDEALAVGDVEFQHKCFDVFERFSREGRTIIFVTHALGSVERFCNKAVLLKSGQIVARGNPHEVIETYKAHAV